MGLSVGRAAGHTRGFTHTIPDGHLESKQKVHLWVLFSFHLGWEGCSWWCGSKNHCECGFTAGVPGWQLGWVLGSL